MCPLVTYPPLTIVEKMIIPARQKGTIRKQRTVLRTNSEVKVDYLKSKQRGPNKCTGAPKDKEKKFVTVPPQKKCDRCLGNNHARKHCPAKMLSVMPVKNVGTTRRHAEVNT